MLSTRWRHRIVSPGSAFLGISRHRTSTQHNSDICLHKMPQYCSVPDCKNRSGGIRFPKDPALKKKWQVAIRRQDPVKKKLWEPGTHAVVCHNHFADSDYREPGLLGKCFMVYHKHNSKVPNSDRITFIRREK